MLGHDGQFELLAPDNYAAAPDKIRYTTMLLAKGLERDVVILVSSPPTDKKILFQLFIEASRAKANVPATWGSCVTDTSNGMEPGTLARKPSRYKKGVGHILPSR